MNQPSLETVWEFYEPERHGDEGGNYILLLKPYGNAPIYSGEARIFKDRFTRHKQNFERGMKTFMRQPFIDGSTDLSHAGFAARWHDYKQQSTEDRERLVWIPTTSPDPDVGKEGKTFWQQQVATLVSIVREGRSAVENRIQVSVMDYYDCLAQKEIDWYVWKGKPETTVLIGHQGRRRTLTGPPLLYRLGEGQASDAGAFFSKLEP